MTYDGHSNAVFFFLYDAYISHEYRDTCDLGMGIFDVGHNGRGHFNI